MRRVILLIILSINIMYYLKMNFQKNIGVNQEFLIVVLKNKQVKSSVVG